MNPLTAAAVLAVGFASFVPCFSQSLSASSASPLKLKWNESVRVLDVTLENPDDKSIEVLGVQTTPGLFVSDFPKNIPPRKTGSISLVYSARSGVSSDIDAVRVLTSAGVREIQIPHQREAVVKLEPASLAWKVAEKPEPKSVTIIVAPGTSAPKSVRVLGDHKNTAVLNAGGAGHYSVLVTPVSTARPGQFSVLIEMEPYIPGLLPTVQCSVNE